MEPEPVAEPTPAPAPKRPVRAAAQKAAQKREEEAEAAAKKKAASGKATAAALQKKLAAQKEAASEVEAAQKARIEELEAELLRQQVRAAEAEASPRSAYGTPAKGQGHVSEENDNLEVELEAALGDEGEGAGEGASAPEPSPETEPPKTPEAVYELVAANVERFTRLWRRETASKKCALPPGVSSLISANASKCPLHAMVSPDTLLKAESEIARIFSGGTSFLKRITHALRLIHFNTLFRLMTSWIFGACWCLCSAPM